MYDDRFLGHDINYWVELEMWAKKGDHVQLIKEISNLRSRVSFYEDRIKQMTEFMELMNG